jgi:Protein of unknown function (DUF2786)
MSEDNDNLIRKIRALRAKAQDSSVTEEEAALYAAKVTELLSAHGLTMAHLTEEKRDDGVRHEKYEMQYTDPWRVSLFRAAEKLYFCLSFNDWRLDEKKDKYVRCRTIVGRPHNVIVLHEMYEYLEQTTLRLARDYARDNPSPHETPRALRIGFERGCGERLAQRLLKMHRDQMADAPVQVNGNPGNPPALYQNENKLLQTYAAQKFNLTYKKTRGSDINAHGAAGMRAADGVSLSTQVGSGSRKSSEHLLS